MSDEYHHYIPQFLLKNYAYPFECPKAGGNNKCKKPPKCKHDKGKHPGDLVLSCIDLTVHPFKLEERPVKRSFGQPGMYHDPSQATTKDQRRIESMFGSLESKASSVFRRIVKAYDDGDKGVKLTRTEKDTVRKFIFLLKYRGSTFHRRFYHNDAEDYSANDRHRLLAYMKEYCFATPLDVWFHNLETIINLEMDPNRDWREKLRTKMFPDDALWFIIHVDECYMAICTPSDRTAEFLLTENTYNIFEGPNNFVKDSATGQVFGGSHTPYHQFAPLSPRLMLVLRGHNFPVKVEDSDPIIKKAREDAELISGSPYPLRKSLLEDLPVEKATNSYSYICNGKIYPSPGYDGTYRQSDTFVFKFHAIANKHVDIMNHLFLDNAWWNTTLVYQSLANLTRIIKSYVNGPCTYMKQVVTDEDESRRYRYLKELEKLSGVMGNKGKLVWRRQHYYPRVTATKFDAKYLRFQNMMCPISRGQTGEEQEPLLAFFTLLTNLGKSIL